MSQVPAEIAGIGSTQQMLRVSPGFDPLKAAVGPEEYFVLSRIDGKQSVREVLLTTGLPVERTIVIITRLRSIGALLLPGESGTPAPAASPKRPMDVQRPPERTSTQPRRTPALGVPIATAPAEVRPLPLHDLTLPNLTAEERAALAEVNDLDESERRRILAIARLLEVHDPHALLGIPAASEAREIKRAYFTLSKEIHPDRYFGKRLGSFAPRMSAVFEASSRAYARLTGTDRNSKSGSFSAVAAENQQPQTPQAYASELFDRACQLEVGGDALEAMKLFAAAVRVDPQLRYLRRATSCALAAGQPRSALEYAKKAHGLAPGDPSSARLLAAAFRAAGKLSDAEEVLVMAMALRSGNDTLAVELRNDLAEIRRLLAQ